MSLSKAETDTHCLAVAMHLPALDERIDKMAETLQDYYDLGANAFGDPTVPSQSDIYVVGRICPGLPAPEEVSEAMEHAKWAQKGAPKLGELGIVLETSKKMGDGDRVQIVFEAECRVRVAPPAPGAQPGDEGDGLFHTDHFGIFPGMLVGLLGRNGTGEAFTVQEILLVSRGQGLRRVHLLTARIALSSHRACRKGQSR